MTFGIYTECQVNHSQNSSKGTAFANTEWRAKCHESHNWIACYNANEHFNRCPDYNKNCNLAWLNNADPVLYGLDGTSLSHIGEQMVAQLNPDKVPSYEEEKGVFSLVCGTLPFLTLPFYHLYSFPFGI